MYTIDSSIVHKVVGWMKERGGVLVWDSVDFSSPEHRVGPMYTEEGKRITSPPGWKFAETPLLEITDPNQIQVFIQKGKKCLPLAEASEYTQYRSEE